MFSFCEGWIMILYMIRHGETDWNQEKKIQGDTDIPLNKNGEIQAKEVAKKLETIFFDVCYTSPLQRAKKTAEIVLHQQCPIILKQELIERDFGKIEGTPIPKEQSQKYWNYDLNSGDDGVEPIQHLLNRTRNLLIDTIEKNRNKTVLFVTHGSTLRALHYNLIGYSKNEDFMKFQVGNCQIFKYTI